MRDREEVTTLELQLPSDLVKLTLPQGLDRRLHALLDKQDSGDELTNDERAEAEGLVDISEFFSLLRLRAKRTGM